MKKIIAVLLVLVFLGLISGLTYLTTDFNDMQIKLVPSEKESKQKPNNPKYHFITIGQNMDDPFWQELKKGVDKAGKDYNVAVEFNAPEFTNIDEELRFLDIAIASRVDGIATNVLNEKEFTPLIDKATKLGIPVVTVGSDAKGTQRISFIGSSSYNLGTEAGKLVARASSGKAEAAFILNNYYAGDENVLQNVMLGGFIDSIKDYPNIKVKTVQTATIGYFSAEEVARNILNDYPNVNMIVCTDSNDTLGVAQVLVDLNRVGSVQVIGYGNTSEILRYVENGVIYGTVVEDPYKIGYESIKMLIEYKEKKRPSSSYIDTGVHSVTKSSLKQVQNGNLSDDGWGKQ